MDVYEGRSWDHAAWDVNRTGGSRMEATPLFFDMQRVLGIGDRLEREGEGVCVGQIAVNGVPASERYI